MLYCNDEFLQQNKENMKQLFQKITQLKVLELFIKNPREEYYLREAARILKMDPATVHRSLNLLLKEGLIKREKRKNLILYKANMENLSFRYIKIAYNLDWLKKKKLLETLRMELPGLSSVILYGSYAKGENGEDSKVELLTISQTRKNLAPLLKKLLKREVSHLNISLAQWIKIERENREFYLDIITNGIVLYGEKPLAG
jgi:predicted nucleotidyltransferase